MLKESVTEDVENLKRIEKASRKLDISEEWPAMRDSIIGYCDRQLNNMETLPAYVHDVSSEENLTQYSIQEAPKNLQEVLGILDKEITTPGINPASGGHIGYIPGGGIPVAALGDYTAAITNKYAGVFYGSPGAVRCENVLIDWMSDLVGYSKNAFGNLASGGSISNLIAMICARDAHGMVGAKAEKGAIYLTPHAHHCIKKSINMAGLGCCHIRYIKQDDNHKMDVDDLRSHIENDKQNNLQPFLVVGNAGTTDTGVVDPLEAIADVCEVHELWYHVDAAYGGFFMLLDELKPLFKGVERSDSIVLDPHKGLFMPYGIGAILVKDRQHLLNSFEYEANYMQDASENDVQISPASVSPELTKHFRGLRMWLPLQIHGLEVFKKALEEKVLLARYFQREVAKLGFEVGQDPELSVTTYRYVPPAGDADRFNKLIIDEVLNDGSVFISSTLINNVFVIRLAVLSFRTHLSTIDTLLSQLNKAKNKILNEYPEFT